MDATVEQILTEQEKQGLGTDELGGMFVVQGRGYDTWHLAVIADNRTAAEDYIREHLREHPRRTLDDYRLEVWAVISQWPPQAVDVDWS